MNSFVKLCSSIKNLALQEARNLGNVDFVPDQTSGSFVLSLEVPGCADLAGKIGGGGGSAGWDCAGGLVIWRSRREWIIWSFWRITRSFDRIVSRSERLSSMSVLLMSRSCSICDTRY